MSTCEGGKVIDHKKGKGSGNYVPYKGNPAPTHRDEVLKNIKSKNAFGVEVTSTRLSQYQHSICRKYGAVLSG